MPGLLLKTLAEANAQILATAQRLPGQMPKALAGANAPRLLLGLLPSTCRGYCPALAGATAQRLPGLLPSACRGYCPALAGATAQSSSRLLPQLSCHRAYNTLSLARTNAVRLTPDAFHSALWK